MSFDPVPTRRELDRVRADLERHKSNTARHDYSAELWVYAPAITGTLTGVTFTVTDYDDLEQETIALILMGRHLKPVVDFTISGATITMTVAPFQSGESLAYIDLFFIASARRVGDFA